MDDLSKTLVKAAEFKNKNNLHDNYVNLTPQYHKVRHDRAVTAMNKAIKENLLTRVKAMQRSMFND